MADVPSSTLTPRLLAELRPSLKKGANDLLMKIVNGDGAHGFYLSIASKQEVKVMPVK